MDFMDDAAQALAVLSGIAAFLALLGFDHRPRAATVLLRLAFLLIAAAGVLWSMAL